MSVPEQEQGHPETGTGWPGAAGEPGDTGWPAGGQPTAVDAVPADVTATPDGDPIALEDVLEQRPSSVPPDEPAPNGRAARGGPAQAGAAPGGPEPDSASLDGAAGGAERTGQADGLADQTVDLSRVGPSGPAAEPAPRSRPAGPAAGPAWLRRIGWAGLRSPRVTSAGAVIGALIALLGFALAVQLRSHTTDPALASARQDDLVRILSDLEAREERSRQEISDLEDRQRQLTSGAQGRQAALQEATERADELGILAGTLPAQGPGLTVRFDAGREPVSAAAVLDAIQELRGAGAEAMQIGGGNGATVRVVASTYVVDASGGIEVDGRRLTAPYTITVIGDGQTMRTALNIAGGVVESVQQDGGNVTVHDPGTVQVKALHTATTPRYARPAK